MKNYVDISCNHGSFIHGIILAPGQHEIFIQPTSTNCELVKDTNVMIWTAT